MPAFFISRAASKPGRAPMFLVAAMTCLPLSSAFAEDKDAIVTDRPDFVESSNVVGKHRLQVETSFALDRKHDGAVVEQSAATPILLRYGINDTLELRMETDGRLRRRVGDAHGRLTDSGYGDLSLGLKWHVADGEGSRPSVGMLVHADLATGSPAMRGAGVRPSLRMAAEWELPAQMSLGVMPGLSLDRTEDGRRFTAAIFGVVIGKAWSERLRSFAEVAAPRIARSRSGGSDVRFDTGVAYLLSDQCQLDSAVSRGLTARSADLSFTVGLSFKL